MLKEVIFRGFKSFADEQTISLTNGINGIIGPNGCGKSNLIDGISFVLGTQSAKNLRGGKMTDLIFGGTDKIKRKDSAEVVLVLDNSFGLFKKSENDTIRIKRKIYRSGASEYCIDDVPCRLRDVQDLFLDTGIGSDSYSIIGQNKIEKILSPKIEERRSIFEEASGITKLRQQKEKTEKNLRDAETDITRIDDVITEIEKQLKPLERQAKKAEEFLVYDTELRSLEMQYLLHEYRELNEVISKNKEKVESLTSLIDDKATILSDSEMKISSLKVEYQTKNNTLFELQNKLSTLKETVEKHKGNITLIEEKISNSQKNIIDYDHRLNEVEKEHTVSADDYKTKQKRIHEISKTLLELNEQLTDVEKNLIQLDVERTTSSIDLDSSKNKLVDLMNKLTRKNFEKEQLENNIKETKEKQANINVKNSSFISDRAALEEIFIEKKLLFDEVKSKIESIDQEVFNHSNELNRLNEQKNVLSNNISNLNNNIYQVSNKISSIQSFIENNDGFYDGVKAILNEKKKGFFSGVIGAVVESIKVDNTYELAYETLLQGSMQHLITVDDSVAKEAVSFLKNNNKGRATFLPLNMAKPYVFDSNELSKIQKTKGIHSALDFVSFDEQVKPVVHSILGRSIIADNLDVAVDFMKKSGIRCRISTLEGDIVQSNSISGGGSKNKKSSLLTKQNELESLTQTLIGLQRELTNLTSSFDSIKEKIDSVIAISKEKTYELNNIRLSSTSIQNEYDKAKLDLDIFNEKNKDIQLEERELSIKLSNYEKQLGLLRIEISDSEKEKSTIEFNLSHSEDSTTGLDSTFEEKREEKTALLLEINTLKEESKQLNAFMDDIGKDSDSLEEKIEKLYRSKQEELINIETQQKEKESEKALLTKVERECLGISGDIDTLKTSCDEINNQINLLEEDTKFDRDEKHGYEKELNKINVLLSKKETEMKTNLHRLNEGYDVTEENISAFELVEIDYEDSRKRIGDLKKKISFLGNVNVDAVEEFKELNERYLNEKTQLDDIRNAKKDLRTLLQNVQDTMTERFTTSFNDISIQFKKTYKEFFEGGNAQLILVEPDSPLESAIEIIAQPPGKKPTSLSLLSGGEKAFTAIALIFAIISVKPSPFVILDEVDAALDEINVIRFARQLNNYKEKSQFVIITHRKGTMMITDTLTGITQKQLGVSIVFPYTIEESEKMIANAK